MLYLFQNISIREYIQPEFPSLSHQSRGKKSQCKCTLDDTLMLVKQTNKLNKLVKQLLQSYSEG